MGRQVGKEGKRGEAGGEESRETERKGITNIMNENGVTTTYSRDIKWIIGEYYE